MDTLDSLLARKPPEQLFHYTSQAGLIGIVAEGKLRASKVSHLNDSLEIALALQMARKDIEERDLSQSLRERLLYNVELMEFSEVNIFVISLTEHPDQLSQWRGYTPPGCGYAIGFDCSALKKSIGRPIRFVLGPCCYETDIQKRVVAEIVSEAVEGRLKLRDPNRTGLFTADDASDEGYFSEALDFAAPFLKHTSFSEEREWRLVSTPTSYKDNDLKHRPGKSFVVPYREVDIRPSKNTHILRTVVIGPTPHPRVARAGVHSLLLSAGINTFTLQYSSIPFRQW